MDGVKKFFGVFTTENHVNVDEVEPTEFFDAHFDIPTIIDNEVSMTADLTFNPPEYYEVQHDMEAQREQLHGLDEFTEVRAGGTVVNAGKIVTRESAEVQPRENVARGLEKEHVLEVEEQEIAIKKEEPVLVLVDNKLTEVETLETEMAVGKDYTSDIKPERDNVVAIERVDGEKENHVNKYKSLLRAQKGDVEAVGEKLHLGGEKENQVGKYKALLKAEKDKVEIPEKHESEVSLKL